MGINRVWYPECSAAGSHTLLVVPVCAGNRDSAFSAGRRYERGSTEPNLLHLSEQIFKVWRDLRQLDIKSIGCRNR